MQYMCALKQQFLVFDPFKAFDKVESSHKWILFLHVCASCSELPAYEGTMISNSSPNSLGEYLPPGVIRVKVNGNSEHFKKA